MHALTAQSGRVLRQGRERLHAAPGVAPPPARPCLCLRTTVQHTAACAGSVGRVQPRGGPPLTPQVWPPLFPDALHNCYGPPPRRGGKAGNSRACPALGAPQWECEGRQASAHVPSRRFTTVGPLHVGIGGSLLARTQLRAGFPDYPPLPPEGGPVQPGLLWVRRHGPLHAFAGPLLQPRLRPCQALCSGPPLPSRAAEVAGGWGPAWESLAGRFHLVRRQAAPPLWGPASCARLGEGEGWRAPQTSWGGRRKAFPLALRGAKT